RTTTMYTETIDSFTKLAERKIAALRAAPGGFFVASMLAGAYVGIGIILIFVLGQQVPPEFQKLVMGATFGIALTLVVIAGAALFARAILCNWLVCLAIWMAARVNSDSAKCIVIFWCLLAFIASGYEHSVANMTLLGLALAGNHPEAVSLAGFAWNLAWVTAGNAVGGAVFVAGAYYVSTYGVPRPAPLPEAVRAESK